MLHVAQFSAHFKQNEIYQTQTEYSTTFGQLSEQKLAKWLRDIYPMVERELQQGVTNVFDFSHSQLAEELFFDSLQSVSAIDKTIEEVVRLI